MSCIMAESEKLLVMAYMDLQPLEINIQEPIILL